MVYTNSGSGTTNKKEKQGSCDRWIEELSSGFSVGPADGSEKRSASPTDTPGIVERLPRQICCHVTDSRELCEGGLRCLPIENES